MYRNIEFTLFHNDRERVRDMVRTMSEVPSEYDYHIILRPSQGSRMEFDSVHIIRLDSVKDLLELSQYIGLSVSIDDCGLLYVDDWSDYVSTYCAIIDRKR